MALRGGTRLVLLGFLVAAGGAGGAWSQAASTAFPAFEFDVWVSPPSREVYSLTAKESVQKILFTIRESALSVADIQKATGETESTVREDLRALEAFQLVTKSGDKWLSNIPLYVEKDFQEAEKLHLRYAEKEAELLRQAIPGLRQLYGRTTLSRFFPWERVSLILTGALLADFCVVDRIPFRADNFNAELQPPLRKPDGSRWGYTGFQKVQTRFPSRRWKFYQNVVSRSHGGTSRFGYMGTPGEMRKTPPLRPDGLVNGRTGAVLLALAEGPLSPQELQARSELTPELLRKTLDELSSLQPPAVAVQDGKYSAGIPVLTESDLALLLPECDRVAEQIYRQVVVPHLEELKQRAARQGSRWPLPADTYVRDKALQILVEKGLLSAVPDAPVAWNFGVWGWKGFLPMHDQVTQGLKPDPFLTTPISQREKEAIEEFDRARAAVLEGKAYRDTSTPWRALLTRISGFAHADLEALKSVQVPASKLTASMFEDPQNKRFAQYLKGIRVWRALVPEAAPKDGDVAAVFTQDEEVNRAAHVFFYYRGSWKVLFNTGLYGLWRGPVEQFLSRALEQARSESGQE